MFGVTLVSTKGAIPDNLLSSQASTVWIPFRLWQRGYRPVQTTQTTVPHDSQYSDDVPNCARAADALFSNAS